MKIGLVCFRLRPDIVGGAERLVMRLGAELQSMGRDVKLLTTTATKISQMDRWRAVWEQNDPASEAPGIDVDLGDGRIETLEVARLPIRPALASWRLARKIQRFEDFKAAAKTQRFLPANRNYLREAAPTFWDADIPANERPWLIGPGWSTPEFSGGHCYRWISSGATLLSPPDAGPGLLTVRGNAPARTQLQLVNSAAQELRESEGKKAGDLVDPSRPFVPGRLAPFIQNRLPGGSFEIVFEIPATPAPLKGAAGLWEFRLRNWFKPRGEMRRLDLMISDVEWRPSATGDFDDPNAPFISTRLWDVFTPAQEFPAAGKSPGAMQYLRGEKYFRDREKRAAKWFDIARGPNVPGLKRRLREFAADRDVLIFASMPFASVNWPQLLPKRKPGKPGPLVFQMPFRHGNDPYYDWRSYEESLLAADGILTLTPVELDGLDESLKAKQTTIGGGGDRDLPANANDPASPTWPGAEERAAARAGLGLPADATILLQLGRKSTGKGYLEIAEAVALANTLCSSAESDSISPASSGSTPNSKSNEPPFLLVMAGPDEDGLPLEGGHVRQLGMVSEEDKRRLFRACDAMVFYSQSESFGLVMLEAWAAGCPVIAGRRSPAAAHLAESLGAVMVDAAPAKIAKALKAWRDTPDAARRERWEAGLDVLRTQYSWRAVAEKTLQAIEENQKHSGNF